MKNHIRKNGQIIQTNKKWSQLKETQKEWISAQLKSEYIDIGLKKSRKPIKEDIENILNVVYEKIEEKNIWISYYEVKKFFLSKINLYNKYLNI